VPGKVPDQPLEIMDDVAAVVPEMKSQLRTCLKACAICAYNAWAELATVAIAERAALAACACRASTILSESSSLALSLNPHFALAALAAVACSTCCRP
jgi:hypothetical protein